MTEQVDSVGGVLEIESTPGEVYRQPHYSHLAEGELK